uniref:Maternal protein exuperantia n=1 Tax=Timema shepardi TaxID=629360 RepID=A0A7R9G4C5_TIMSH|nr:unnamed protein product [Timema shepardi]
MVSTSKENGFEIDAKLGIPVGKYYVVGWDVDTTGRRLVDEICQIAAFSKDNSFSQYVMPYRDLNMAAKRRHNIRVVTIGRYRMLKDSKSGKILKTKSEISALNDFLHWLEELRGKDLDGVLLVSHEPRKCAPALLLESLRRYNLVDRFMAVVKGFVNSYTIAELKCAKTVKSFSLRTLSKVLLDKEGDLDNAMERARLAYQVTHHLCGGDEKPETAQGAGDAREASTSFLETICGFVWSIKSEEEELEQLKGILKKQNSLRPIFWPLLRFSRKERQRASGLRRLLVDAGVEYESLTVHYAADGKQGISKLLETVKGEPKEIEELQDILLGHFDPDHKPKPEAKPEPVQGKVLSGENASGTSTPDTTESSPMKSPSSGSETNVTSSVTQSLPGSPGKQVSSTRSLDKEDISQSKSYSSDSPTLTAAHGRTSHARTTVGSAIEASKKIQGPSSPQMGRNLGAVGDSTPLERPVPVPIQPTAVEISETASHVLRRSYRRTKPPERLNLSNDNALG